MVARATPLRRLALAAVLALGGCATGIDAGGGLISSTASKAPIEVRGYALAPDQVVPPDAIGYAVPIFASREQAASFCPQFISRLSFNGALDARAKMVVRSYGRTVRIAPFVWPVTAWPEGQAGDCKALVDRYNVSGAKTFQDLALGVIGANGGAPAKRLGGGPYIMLARRASGTVMLLDLSRAPKQDYPQWLDKAVGLLGDANVGGSGYVTTSMRDDVRFYVFGAIPSFSGVLNLLIPGYASEHDKT